MMKFNMKLKMIFFMILSLAFFSMFYQNCSSDVSIKGGKNASNSSGYNSNNLTFSSDINICSAPLISTTTSTSRTTSSSSSNSSSTPSSDFSQTQTELVEFNIVNLTARIIDGDLEPDSDMDGLIDKQDPNPLSRRTNSAHLLDSICLIFGGPTKCATLLNCELKSLNQLGLNACDLGALNLAQSTSVTIFDKDFDLIPDFIEVLFSLSPSYFDATDDSDHDGLLNLDEIHKGGNPIDSKTENPDDQILWTKQKIQLQTCPSGNESWKVKLEHIPLISVLKYNSDSTENLSETVLKDSNPFFLPSDLYHDENQNVFFIYYITQTKDNSNTGIKRTLWGQLQKIKTSDNLLNGFYLKTFEKLGEMINAN